MERLWLTVPVRLEATSGIQMEQPSWVTLITQGLCPALALILEFPLACWVSSVRHLSGPQSLIYVEGERK